MRNYLMALFTCLAIVSNAAAITLVVNIEGGDDYTSIQPALDATADGDTVLVMPGTYVGAENRNLDFDSKNLTLRSNNFNQTSIIDCEGLGRALFLNDGQDRSSIIEGLVFQNGIHATTGGALYFYGASPSVRYCHFIGNESVQGGAIYFFGAGANGMLMENCSFNENHGDYGGALFATGLLAPNVYGCVFTDNSSDLKGGAIYCTNSSSGWIRSSDFLGNSSFNGGAISLNYSSSPEISTCFFDGNSAEDGGAIGTFNGCAPDIESCTFVHNTATEGGCLHFAFNSNPIVHQCILSFSVTGATMYCGSSLPQIYHNLIWSNGGGNDLCGDYHDNIYLNPQYCGTTNLGPYTLQSDSPAAAANNDFDELLGALPVDCDESAAEASNWSRVKRLY
jgi:predicted outer membrane repeat protein